MFFYEVHEGDEELGAAVLLGHEQRFEPEEFLRLVKTARAHVLESYVEDTLSEAIANELQRTLGFIHVTDDMLVAAVNVGEDDDDIFLVTQGEDQRTIFLDRDENGHRDGEEERPN